MFILIPDLRMFYELDAFRYDIEAEEVILSICNFRMELVIKGVNRAKWLRIRSEILHDYYFDISSYEWDIKLV